MFSNPINKSQPCAFLGRKKDTQSPVPVDRAAGVCIVKRDVITTVCRTFVQTPGHSTKQLFPMRRCPLLYSGNVQPPSPFVQPDSKLKCVFKINFEDQLKCIQRYFSNPKACFEMTVLHPFKPLSAREGLQSYRQGLAFCQGGDAPSYPSAPWGLIFWHWRWNCPILLSRHRKNKKQDCKQQWRSSMTKGKLFAFRDPPSCKLEMYVARQKPRRRVLGELGSSQTPEGRVALCLCAEGGSWARVPISTHDLFSCLCLLRLPHCCFL